MKKISQLLKRKKEKKPPLFQIRRHTFEYSQKNGKKRKKYIRLRTLLQSLSLIRVSKKQLRILLIITMVGIAGVGSVLSFNLTIREILITRENSLIDINEAYRNLEYIRGRSILNLQRESITSRLQSSQSVIQRVDIRRRFPRGIEVHIVPYRPLFQTTEGLIMTSGNIFETSGERRNDIAWLDVSGYEPSLLSSGPDFSLIDLRNITQLIEELEKNIVGFDVAEKKYYIKEREIHLRDSAGTIYLFDLTHSVILQTEKLSIYFREKQKSPSERDMTYIDVRVPRGLFICPLTEETICNRNLQNLYGEDAGDFTSEIIPE